MVLLDSEHGFQALCLKLFLVQRTHKHEVCKVADDIKRIGDSTFPHLLPDSVNLILSCSGNHEKALR